jgi:DHA1 family tetracycline resistance protein-like MFS transporter
MMSAASIIGPPMMNGLFAYFTGPEAPIYFPGAAMLLGAVLTLASAVWARSSLKKNMKPVEVK